MTVSVDSRGAEGEAWLTRKLAELLKRCYRRGVGDDVIVSVFGELLLASQESAEAVLTALKELTAIDEDDDEGGAAYA